MTAHGDPFHLPDDGRRFWVVNVSGGRSSGMLLHQVLAAHDGVLPPHARACFANTGKEREQTLDFVRDMGREWGVPITWVEYRFDPSAICASCAAGGAWSN